MQEIIPAESHIEKAVLVGLIDQYQDETTLKEYLDELAFLAETAGAQEVKRFTQRLEKPDVRSFVGKGKLEEIRKFVSDNNIDLVIFDDELSPSQLRNIENEIKKKIHDRNSLILEIFAQRAQTAHAKAQVELAQLEYMLPRLTRMWTHLERQRGGTGTRGGAGEKEIETDRRIVRVKIARLKEKLKEIDKQKATQRKSRGNMVRVSLVGYTNVGKSTIMNMLSKSEVFAENKLFATLDTTVRKVVIGNLPFLLSDTVGFIRKLPHQLVESFKSTLDEVRESDLLLHVVDISHPKFADQVKVVNETLHEIGIKDKPVITVFNKTDLYTPRTEGEFDFTGNEQLNYSIDDLRKSWMAKNTGQCVFISAINKENTDELKETIYENVKKIHIKRYPYDHFLY
jgi:GTPase